MRDPQATHHVSADHTYTRGVLLLDGLESTLLWTATGTGAGYAVTAETAAAYHGAKGMQLLTRLAGAQDGDVAVAQRSLCYPASHQLVYRVRLGIPDVSDLERVSAYLLYSDGGLDWDADISYHPQTGVVSVLDAAGVRQTVAGLTALVADGDWLCLEAQLDLHNHTYGPIRAHGLTGDPSPYGHQAGGAATQRRIQLGIGIETNGAVQGILYADDFCLTEYPED